MADNRYANIADRDAKRVSEEKLKLSFVYIDWDSEEFFFHGLESQYYQKFFWCMSELQSATERQIAQQTHPSLRPKSIFNSDTSIKNAFPVSVIERVKQQLFVETRDEAAAADQAKEITARAFEVSLSKNYGRVHGFLWNNTFHIVWVDPAHNLFPMGRKITKHQDAAVVRCFSPEECHRLQEIIRQLQIENEELLEAFANQ
ncbi:hypothetical protein [Methylomonas sp. HYX-M1]|uniref:hypothetical protein n=1 Tax=Methylomonas sp. HYX-M1 TaxID=3139307 RepID=UPI00345C0F1E